MPTQEQALRAYQEHGDYRQASQELGVPPGQAYITATGLPADGGDTFPPGEVDRPAHSRAALSIWCMNRSSW